MESIVTNIAGEIKPRSGPVRPDPAARIWRRECKRSVCGRSGPGRGKLFPFVRMGLAEAGDPKEGLL
ncbi:MAG: hypothetical protein HQK81_14620 [Desulfovibrionaceae bacterium]|nr:hypothetical protein [Desulfovibrionaceae bacterium]MBF0515278.1 hypothetical protein [Desulfovibrionaceae bacterium]